MEGISRTEFADAVGAAIGSVRHFYREVDRLVAGLKEALREEPDPLKVVRGSTGKGSSAKQQGRVVLRDEYSILFEPEAEEPLVADGGDEEDDEDEENDDPEETEGTTKRRSAPAELDPDQPLLALRLTLSTPHSLPGFEPALQYAVLGDWWISGTKPPDSFLVKRYMLRRIPVMLGKVTDDSKRVVTAARVAGKGKSAKGDRRISCRILGGIHTVALYDLDDPKALDELAVRMKEYWHNVTEGTVG